MLHVEKQEIMTFQTFADKNVNVKYDTSTILIGFVLCL